MKKVKTPTMHTKQIVVIDDSVVVRELIKLYCKRVGLCCEAFANGPDALRWVATQEKPPELIFLDIKLPEIDGYNIATRLKKRFPDVSIVMLTAYTGIFEKLLARLAGVSLFVSKPFTEGQISQILYSLASPRWLLDQLNHVYVEQLSFLPGSAQRAQLNKQFKLLYDALVMKHVAFHHERQQQLYVFG
jgi:CheY-like chemotaxis protein